MVSSLRSQRSQLLAQNQPTPTRSGDSLTPPHGYSSLFTSGLLRSAGPLTPPPGIRAESFATPPRSQSRAAHTEGIVMSCADPSIPSPVAFATATASPYTSRLQPPRSQSRVGSNEDVTMSAGIPSIAFPTATSSPFRSRLHAPRSPCKTQRPSPSRRLPSSPSKLRAPPTLAADRALTDVMHKLRLYAGGLSPNKPKRASRNSPLKESRWSSSSEESGGGGTEGKEDDGEGFWRPRKSGESTRSKMSKVGTVKSKKSTWSLRSRKSEDGDRPWGGETEERPPMPEWNAEVGNKARGKFGVGVKKVDSGGAGLQAPTTPGRGRRVVEGLARRLGLTPKKKNAPPTPSRPVAMPDTYRDMLPPPLPTCITQTQTQTHPYAQPRAQTPAPSTAPIDTNLPQPPRDPNLPLPRKTSLSTLRSLAKKTSTGTLRSVWSIYGYPTTDEPTPNLPLLPPTTPRRAVVKKSSMGPIGQPKATRPSFSPSLFDSLPRRAPKTPDRADGEAGQVTGGVEEGMMDVDEVITFSGTRRPINSGEGAKSPKTPDGDCGDIEFDAYLQGEDEDGDRTLSPVSRPTADISTPRATLQSYIDSPISPDSPPSPTSPIDMDIDEAEFSINLADFQSSTPISQRNVPLSHIPAFASSAFDTPPRSRGATPPLTVKQMNNVNGSGGREQKINRSKSRLLRLLPTYSRQNSGQNGQDGPCGIINSKGGGVARGVEAKKRDREVDQGLMPRFKRSFSRSRNNASTPNLKNGLPAPAPTALLPSSRINLHLGNTSSASGFTPPRPPLAPILPSNNINNNARAGQAIIAKSPKPKSTLGYTYRSGAVSRADAIYPSSPSKSTHGRDEVVGMVPRPATSQGHHYRSKPMVHYPQAHPYVYTETDSKRTGKRDTFGGGAVDVIDENGSGGGGETGTGKEDEKVKGNGKGKIYARRRVPDFSRPMSAQDLDSSFASNTSDQTIGRITDSHFPATTTTTTTTPSSSPSNPQATTDDLAGHPLLPTSSRPSPGRHERMSSKDSLMTASTTCTAETYATGVSGTSGWELERYLKELESEDEAHDQVQGVCRGEGKGRMERMEVDSEDDQDMKGNGKSGLGERVAFGAGGVIQQAKYGIRI